MPSVEGDRGEPWPDRWMRRRCSAAVTLTLRNVYIVPSRFGWLWLLTSGVMAALGGWANRGSVLLVAAGSLVLFLLAPSLTQANLQGLELRCGQPPLCCAGTTAFYPLELHSRCERLQLRVFFHRPGAPAAAWCGSTPAGVTTLLVPWSPRQRGRQRPGCLRLESQAPLGLFHCWTLWEPAREQLVAPAPQPSALTLPTPQAQRWVNGADDWQDLAPHRPEQGSGRIAWKQLARSGRRLSKCFSDPQPLPESLSPNPALPWELALQQLCGQCLLLARSNVPFGLTVADQQITAASGTAHLQRCLTALALAPRCG